MVDVLKEVFVLTLAGFVLALGAPPLLLWAVLNWVFFLRVSFWVCLALTLILGFVTGFYRFTLRTEE